MSEPWAIIRQSTGHIVTVLNGEPRNLSNPPDGCVFMRAADVLPGTEREEPPEPVYVWSSREFRDRFKLMELSQIAMAGQQSPTIATLLLLVSTADEIRTDSAQLLSGMRALIAGNLLIPDQDQTIEERAVAIVGRTIP